MMRLSFNHEAYIFAKLFRSDKAFLNIFIEQLVLDIAQIFCELQ